MAAMTTHTTKISRGIGIPRSVPFPNCLKVWDDTEKISPLVITRLSPPIRSCVLRVAKISGTSKKAIITPFNIPITTLASTPAATAINTAVLLSCPSGMSAAIIVTIIIADKLADAMHDRLIPPTSMVTAMPIVSTPSSGN